MGGIIIRLLDFSFVPIVMFFMGCFIIIWLGFCSRTSVDGILYLESGMYMHGGVHTELWPSGTAVTFDLKRQRIVAGIHNIIAVRVLARPGVPD